jgi:hypothetical protein
MSIESLKDRTMSTAELVEQLKYLSNPERLAVIEAATRLIREDLSATSRRGAQGGIRPLTKAKGIRIGFGFVR